MKNGTENNVVIIGAGFTGLSLAYELSKAGVKVLILESSSSIGGLASSFDVGGEKLDCFYHHWFTSDYSIMNIISELGLNDKVLINPTNTGLYYANNFYKMSTPIDVLRFTPLSILNRFRLGLLVLRARSVKKWKSLESLTAVDWLKKLGGEKVYRIVWEPLIKGKFGPYADDISAVWFWNKIKLRGGSRGNKGEEKLAYFKGGFAALADEILKKIKECGGKIYLDSEVNEVYKEGKLWNIKTRDNKFISKNVVFTTSLPIISNLIKSWASDEYLNNLNKINYLGNVCLILELNQSLSNTYWTNVNDPSFPFVGLIEHTNFEKSETYGGKHIVYLSKYLSHSDPIFSMDKNEFFNFSYPFIKKMFPKFNLDWVEDYHIWKSKWSQPVVVKKYSELIPKEITPYEGMYICSMAQIYPEDRGTNYAVKYGTLLASKIIRKL